ncbi:MAG: DUF882 domain-containing protein, partial [Bacteroidota bacterium]
ITSGYRTASHNASLRKSVKNSKHLLGMAADIVVRGVSHQRVQSYVDALGIGGVGFGETFTHIDVVGEARRWTY